MGRYTNKVRPNVFFVQLEKLLLAYLLYLAMKVAHYTYCISASFEMSLWIYSCLS